MRLPDLTSSDSIIHTAKLNTYVEHYFGRTIDQILAPIGDNQVGESIRHNGVYFNIKEARHEDDATLPQCVGS